MSTDGRNFAIDNFYKITRLKAGSEDEMAYIEPATLARTKAGTAARPNGHRAGFVAYTAFTLSVGFAAAVVLGLVH